MVKSVQLIVNGRARDNNAVLTVQTAAQTLKEHSGSLDAVCIKV